MAPFSLSMKGREDPRGHRRRERIAGIKMAGTEPGHLVLFSWCRQTEGIMPFSTGNQVPISVCGHGMVSS